MAVPGVSGFVNQGKLQLQLYMLAARAFGVEPVGGLYQPLGAYDDRRPRGIVLKDECGEGVLGGMPLSTKGDAVDAEAFAESLEDARALAIEQGGRMLAGDITRDPIGGKCSEYCTFQPICRLERALGLEEADERDD